MSNGPTKQKLTRDEIIRRRNAARPSFDVTCTIGTVYLDGEGDHTPMEAAMLLIARHEAPGTFRFPHPVSGTIAVTVDHEEDHHA